MDTYSIEIDIGEKEDYINTYNKNKLSDSLCDYILEEIKNANTKNKITLVINSNFKMDYNEKQKFISMLRRSFGTNVSEIIKISKKKSILNWVTFILGIIFLLFYFLINKEIVLTEIILIIGWVLIWETTYNMLFGGVETRLKILRRKQIINSKITFNHKE